MELSYKAYNSPTGRDLPPVPGGFMNGCTQTAVNALINNGFTNIEYFNYGDDEVVVDWSTVAHIIGRRTIRIINNDTSNNDGGNTNGYIESIGNLSEYTSLGDRYSNSFIGENILNNTGNQTDGLIGNRDLVIVDIRGSVTMLDWILNISTALNTCCDQFVDGKDIVMQSLFTGTGEDNCSECSGAGCAICEGYITYYQSQGDLQNPIILVTGHSLGAAVANLTAAALSSCDATEDILGENGEMAAYACDCHEGTHHTYSEEDVYAYTFATPATLNKSKHTNANAHSNIFNIMNNNDAVPFVPRSINVGESKWTRHGYELFVTMPMDLRWLSCVETAHLGLGGHAMPTYMSWLENLPSELNIPADHITIEDLPTTNDSEPLGLLPRILKVKCPVDVTINNADGQPVAFVTSQTGETVGIPDGLTKDTAGTTYVNEETGEVSQCGTVATDGSGIVCWTDTDGAKYIMLPYGYGIERDPVTNEIIKEHPVNAEIKAYADGEMDISVETAGLGRSINRSVRNDIELVYDVELQEGSIFMLTVPANLETTPIALVDTETNQPITKLSEYLYSASIDQEVVPVGTESVFTIVTAGEANKVQIINADTGSTATLDRNAEQPSVEITDNSDGTTTWVYTHAWTTGNRDLSIGVKLDTTWYVTERVLRQVVYTPS